MNRMIVGKVAYVFAAAKWFYVSLLFVTNSLQGETTSSCLAMQGADGIAEPCLVKGGHESMVEPTGYIHLLCGVYAPSVRFEQNELAAMQARDPKSMIRCPECHEATESRSFLPTYKTEPRAAVQS
jgi:hypothetical protein